jgi:hypothetical protein
MVTSPNLGRLPKRKCNKCGALKEDPLFPFRNKAAGIRHTICKKCNQTGGRDHYNNYKSYYKEKAKKRSQALRAALRDQLFEYLSLHPCMDCKESDPIVLEFDHVRGEKVRGISAMVSGALSWSTILEEISKCEVVCANCHRRRTYARCNSYRLRGMT